MIHRKIKIGKKIVKGYHIRLPRATLVLVATSKGYICCGYLDMKTAERLGDVACKVTGVKSISDVIKAKIIDATSFAKEKGIAIGMRAEDVLQKFL